jgi:hypothetical protein
MFYVEPSQTGTCEVKSKNPYDEESSVYSFSFTAGSSQWSLGTLNVPIFRISPSGSVYVKKDYGTYQDMDIQVYVSNTCSTQKGTSSGDFRNTRNFDSDSATEYALYWRINFSGGALYLPTSRLNTTLYIYARDHQCPSTEEDLPVSNVESFSSSTNEYSSEFAFMIPPDLIP